LYFNLIFNINTSAFLIRRTLIKLIYGFLNELLRNTKKFNAIHSYTTLCIVKRYTVNSASARTKNKYY